MTLGCSLDGQYSGICGGTCIIRMGQTSNGLTIAWPGTDETF